MDRLQSIVVGVDYTACSKDAMVQALRLSAWNRAKVHVVHVIDTLVMVELQESLSPMVQEIERGLVNDATKAWEEFTQGMGEKKPADFAVAINNPLIELMRRCRDRKADLLVLGAHGITHDRGVGTLAGQLVRRAASRVLLVHPGQTGGFKQIVVGIDFSETSRDALRNAMRLAAQDNAHVHAVHVYRAPSSGFFFKPSGVDTSPEAQARHRDALRTKLEEFCRPDDPQVQWTSPRFELVANASHGAGLVEYAKQSGADLVVIGTRGKTNLREVLLGSTAERVLRQAGCSILAVKPADAAV